MFHTVMGKHLYFIINLVSSANKSPGSVDRRNVAPSRGYSNKDAEEFLDRSTKAIRDML